MSQNEQNGQELQNHKKETRKLVKEILGGLGKLQCRYVIQVVQLEWVKIV